MRRYTTLYLMILTCLSLYGQSDVDLNHNWIWRLDHNPATIKNNGYLEVDMLGRFQWIGFEGAPKTYLASGSWFHSGINSGFAALVMSDVLGFTKKNTFKGMYSYAFALNDETSMFTMGLSVGITQQSIDQNKIITVNDVINSDAVSYYVEDDGFKPDMDFGITYTYRSYSYSGDDNNEPLLQIGASVTHINQIFNSTNNANCNYYAYAAFNLPFGQMRFVPGLSVVRQANITSASLHAMARNKNFWGGGAWKMQGKIIALVGGLNISDYIGLGYAANFTYSNIGSKSRTSHEVFLIIRIPNKHDHNCPAFSRGTQRKNYGNTCNNYVM
jgi:type IX secretion system PorP/SprF family membrane protein